MRFQVSILQYLGLFNNGVLVLISIIYNDKYYEGTFFYNEEDIVLTVSNELETVLGNKIIDDVEYVDILKNILKLIAPYNEVIKQLKPFDP